MLEHPIKIFAKVYGLSNILLKLIYQRFECFSSKIFLENEIEKMFFLLKDVLTLDLKFDRLYLYNLILLDYSNSYKTFRHLFNLPVNGQRT